MVDVECTRCGASGTNYKTEREAKLTLEHNKKCGQKIGIVKYYIGKKPEGLSNRPDDAGITDDQSIITPSASSDTSKPKKKKAKKKADS